MPLQIETQPFQFNNTVTGLSSAVFSSVSASGGNSNQWNTAYQSVSTVPYIYSGSSGIKPKKGNNTASGTYSVVVGGYGNTASGVRSTVSGGYSNNASGNNSTVAGGNSNTASGYASNVAGGNSNTACGYASNVAGGNSNTACGSNSNVAGRGNTASGNYSNISGGYGNTACGIYASVLGGTYNIASGYQSNVAGGYGNTACGDQSNVAGGGSNTISSYANSSGILNGNTNSIIGTNANIAWWSGIGSGCENIIKGGQSSFIGAGQGNTNSGYASIIGAGNANNIITPQNSITSYWSLDESSGNRLDRYNSNTLYQHNTVPSTTGLINNGIVGNGSGWLETTASFDFSGDFSINYWTIPTTNGSQQQFSGTDRLGLNFNVTNSYIYYGIPNVTLLAEYYPPGGIPTYAWSMATLVRYRNYISMYLNGVLVAGPNYNGSNYSSVIALLALPGGAYVGASNGTKMDEVGIWKRALTNAEVTNLYNNGHGVSYTFNVAAGLYYSSIESGTNNYIGSNCSFIAAGSNNNIPPGSDNTFILGSNIQALSANFTYVNSLELANTPSVLILKDTTGKRWKIGVNTSGTPVGLGAA